MHYFRNNFRQALGLHAPSAPQIFNFGGLKSCVIWLNYVFQIDYDEIKLLKISYNVISVMSSFYIAEKLHYKLKRY